MATDNIKKAADDILKSVGGKENIEGVTHCMTRLRLYLKDKSKIDYEELDKIEEVKGHNFSGDQFQLILGPGVVNKIYKVIIVNFDEDEMAKKARGSQNKFQSAIGVLGDIFIPLIPIIITSGILMGLRTFFVQAGIINEESTAFIMSKILTDTAFTFLPAFVAYSTMKRFGGNPVVGFVIGLMLVNPVLPSPAAIAKGNADPLVVTLFGINFQIASYASSVLPALFVGIFASYVEKLCKKIVPDVVDIIFTPLITTVFAFFVGFFVIGPMAGVLEDVIVNFYVSVLTLPLGIGAFITAFLQQFLVITGLHHGLWIIDINLLDTTGVDIFQPIRNASTLSQGGPVLAFAFFSQNKKVRGVALAAFISILFGVSEPAIFGVTLIYGLPFLLGAIGAGVGGMLGSLMGLAPPGMGVAGVPAIFLYLGSGQFVLMVIQSLVTIGVGFTLTYFFIKKKKL